MAHEIAKGLGVAGIVIGFVLLALAGESGAQTTPKTVSGNVELFVTHINSDPMVLHVRPLTAMRGPLNERAHHNEYEELRAQHNPMSLHLMPRDKALEEGVGKDGKFHTDYVGRPCRNKMCSEWPRRR